MRISKSVAACLFLALLSLATFTHAQSYASAAGSGSFSRVAVGAEASTLGFGGTVVTNVDRYANLRFSGNVYKVTVTDFKSNGFTMNPSLNLASMGVMADVYPFPNHGFRLSPGVLVYNANTASTPVTVPGGQSFSLNGSRYFASKTNPVSGSVAVGLNTQKPAFTLTAGWGNPVRDSGHFSFPVEVGVAFVGAPSVNMVLKSGQVCTASGTNCVNVATDTALQSSLQKQIAVYKNDLEPLKTFPIVSFGVVYSFRVRSAPTL